jgi:hypothetical protein
VIYMCACLLLDPFQQYLEMSVIFSLSICTASAQNCIVGTGNALQDLFLWGRGGWNCNDKVGQQVTAEKMNIISYLHVGKCPYTRDISLG